MYVDMALKEIDAKHDRLIYIYMYTVEEIVHHHSFILVNFLNAMLLTYHYKILMVLKQFPILRLLLVPLVLLMGTVPLDMKLLTIQMTVKVLVKIHH